MTWLLFLALAQPTPQDDPQKEIDKLRLRVRELEAERDRLKEEVEAYRQQCVETAREIFELRQQMKAEGRAKEDAKSDGRKSDVVEDGPETPMRARVMFIDKDQGFFLLNAGRKEGVKPGWKFEIVREVKKEKNLVTERVAVAEVLKLVGNDESHAKLKVIEGDILKVQLDDDAIAFRRTRSATPARDTGEGGKKVYRVSGRTGDVFLLNFGRLDGAAPATIVYVYRDRKLVAKLRIDSVEKDYSIARVTDSARKDDIREGDVIELQEIRNAVVARLKHVHRRNGIYLDVGTDAGARSGMKMRVSRQGKQVGEIVLDRVEKLWSTAKLGGETKFDDLKEGDFAEEAP
ncbi:MAG: hypothetical protein HYY17_07875 [Planctomycetes bacterium]|nr:hypothetical protein [Planctomycetota bacterium]